MSFESLIRACLHNIGAIMLVLSLVIGFSLIARGKSRIPASEQMLRWVLLVGVGLVGVYTFAMHAFFPAITSKMIGWEPSPFEYEVAIANLSVAILCIASFRASYGFRLATVIGTSCWLWGDAVGHIIQMAASRNFAPGNAGSWFWCDILVPAILIFLIVRMKRYAGYMERERAQ